MAATLKDVAALAGVSIKTVSNVVNGYGFVKPENRRRVEAALEATGYRPNVGARNLRRGRTGFIAMVVPELSVPYFGELVSLVITAAAAHDWSVLIEQTQGWTEEELQDTGHRRFEFRLIGRIGLLGLGSRRGQTRAPRTRRRSPRRHRTRASPPHAPPHRWFVGRRVDAACRLSRARHTRHKKEGAPVPRPEAPPDLATQPDCAVRNRPATQFAWALGETAFRPNYDADSESRRAAGEPLSTSSPTSLVVRGGKEFR